jgi:hypothetical protein
MVFEDADGAHERGAPCALTGLQLALVGPPRKLAMAASFSAWISSRVRRRCSSLMQLHEKTRSEQSLWPKPPFVHAARAARASLRPRCASPAEWWKHADAIARLEALWRAWEHLRQDPHAGMSVWFRDHADHHMEADAVARGPGPSACERRCRLEEPERRLRADLIARGL